MWKKWEENTLYMSLWNSILSCAHAVHFCTELPQPTCCKECRVIFFFFFVFWSCLVHLVWVSSLEALNGTWSNVFVAVVLFRFPRSHSLPLFPLFVHASAVLLFRISFGFLTNRHIKFVFAVLQTLIIMSNLFLLLPLLLPLTSSSSSTYFSPLIKYDKTEVDIVVIYVVWLMLTSA